MNRTDLGQEAGCDADRSLLEDALRAARCRPLSAVDEWDVGMPFNREPVARAILELLHLAKLRQREIGTAAAARLWVGTGDDGFTRGLSLFVVDGRVVALVMRCVYGEEGGDLVERWKPVREDAAVSVARRWALRVLATELPAPRPELVVRRRLKLAAFARVIDAVRVARA